MKKVRIDKLLVDRGLVESRERAQALIMAGDVLVADRPVEKAGVAVDPEADIRLRRPDHPFASRGGVKLAGALDALGVDPAGLVAADFGASTGGFTDCLLHRGALRVYAIDVDTSQLHWRLAGDARVRPVQGNARYLDASWLPEPVDLVTIDVSFISVTMMLAPAATILKPGGRAVVLVKPQFEVGPEQVGPGGVVTDPALHEAAVRRVRDAAVRTSLAPTGSTPSPLRGKEGNQEFFLRLERS